MPFPGKKNGYFENLSLNNGTLNMYYETFILSITNSKHSLFLQLTWTSTYSAKQPHSFSVSLLLQYYIERVEYHGIMR